MDNISGFLETLLRAILKEVTTVGGRVNLIFGVIFAAILLAGYGATGLDYALAAFATGVLHTNVGVPGMPWWAPLTFLAYAVFCVVYVDQRTMG